jgi:hypothetical protein
MPRRLLPALLTLWACQQAPSPGIETGAENLARGTVDAEPSSRTAAVAPSKPTRPSRDLHDHPTLHPVVQAPPALSVQTQATASPAGAVSKGLVDSITLSVDLLGADPGELALEIIAPNGTPYERHATQMQGTAFDAQHFEFVLPVAGTWIDSQSLTGSWSANVFVAGVAQQALTFDIEP